MTCEFYLTEQDGQKLVGSVHMEDGGLTFETVPGYEVLMAGVSKSPVVTDDKVVAKEKNPQLWFDYLPRQYNGSYLRAGMKK